MTMTFRHVLAAVLLAAGSSEAQESRPNVILMFSDDQGTLDLGCYGSADLHTPHLDALARRGVRFTQFYSAAAICSPSRAALLTGRYPQRAGVPGNVPIRKHGLPSAQVTVAEMLKAAGYATGIVGKWHLGVDGPNNHGFDSFFGHKRGCIDNYSHFFYWSGPNVHDLWRDDTEVWEDGVHFGDLMVREAQAFLRRHQDRPFFLYLPFNLPHYPLQGQAKYREMYRDLPSPRREYAALVSTLDDKVGQILATLDELKLTENTLVIFMSDHGHSTEVRTMGGGGNAGPFRGQKFSFFEAGIRVPAIVSWPGQLPEGEVRDQWATAVDWLPTIAELCGAEVPAGVDGVSIQPLIRRADAPAPHEVFHWAGGKQWAVRMGDWKLLRNAGGSGPDEKTFLANLVEDPTERRNFAAAHPDIVERLRAAHERWAESVGNR